MWNNQPAWRATKNYWNVLRDKKNNKGFYTKTECNQGWSGNILTEKEDILGWWKQHYEKLLNDQQAIKCNENDNNCDKCNEHDNNCDNIKWTWW